LRKSGLVVKQLLLPYCTLAVNEDQVEFCKYPTELYTAVIQTALSACGLYAGDKLAQRAVCKPAHLREDTTRLMRLSCAISSYQDWHHSERGLPMPRAELNMAVNLMSCMNPDSSSLCTLTEEQTQTLHQMLLVLVLHLEMYEKRGMTSGEIIIA
jgi:hypothetical protein